MIGVYEQSTPGCRLSKHDVACLAKQGGARTAFAARDGEEDGVRAQTMWRTLL